MDGKNNLQSTLESQNTNKDKLPQATTGTSNWIFEIPHELYIKVSAERNLFIIPDLIYHLKERPTTLQNIKLSNDTGEIMEILIFHTSEAEAMLSTKGTFIVDGSYHSCPHPFKTFYSIHAYDEISDTRATITPLVFAFLAKRSTVVLKSMFKSILDKVPGWRPVNIITNYTGATCDALRYIFPDTRLLGCYFEYTEALWRKASNLQIKHRDQRRIVALCCLLPLLPPAGVPIALKYIDKERKPYCKLRNMQLFWNYLHYWIKSGLLKMINGYDQNLIFPTKLFITQWHNNIEDAFKNWNGIDTFIPKILELEPFTVDTTPDPAKLARQITIENNQMFFCHYREAFVPLFLEKLRK